MTNIEESGDTERSNSAARSAGGLIPWITVCAVTLGLLTSAVTAWTVFKKEEENILRKFHADVGQRTDALDRELKLHIEVLHALKVLFNRSGDVSHRDFAAVASDILARHSGIQALEWIPRVPHDDRLAFVERRRVYFPDFSFTERLEQGLMTKAKERDVYFPVYYVEPMSGNEAAFGFDLASNAVRRSTLLESRDRSATLATESITLVQESADQKAFIVFLPVYFGRPTTVESRRAKHRGFVLGVYRIGDIFESSVLRTPLVSVNLVLSDETSDKSDVLLSFGEEITAGVAGGNKLFSRDITGIGGRIWRVTAMPSAGYIDSRHSLLPYAIFLIGLVFVVAVAFIIVIISRRTTVTAQLVEARTRELRAANEKLEKLSVTDGLTGIANRRRFDEVLDQEWRRAMRGQYPVTILMIDIDYFKAFNDSYGHQAGDTCLHAVAGALAGVIGRPSDLVARYGGEEFVAILTQADTGAQQVAERCRDAVTQLEISHENSETSEFVSVSIGVASRIPSQSSWPQELIGMADKALFRAKQQGRNRVVFA